ncbi:MAG: collagen-like protein, partial [Candidatus Pacebacteria bacterium]|nr:collagen-like protein [Candidatus Paceibacterota bacterium]
MDFSKKQFYLLLIIFVIFLNSFSIVNAQKLNSVEEFSLKVFCTFSYCEENVVETEKDDLSIAERVALKTYCSLNDCNQQSEKKNTLIKTFSGKDGKDGKDGVNGINGEKGSRGLRGYQGVRGLVGEKGEQGPRGRGSSGPRGSDGVDGQDATGSDALVVDGLTAIYSGSDHIECISDGYILQWDAINSYWSCFDPATISAIQTLTTITDNGDGTFSYLDEQNNTTTIDVKNLETTTGIVLNINSLDFTDEDGSTTNINLTPYLDNTDAQQINLSGNTLTLSNGTAADTTADLSIYLDDTDTTYTAGNGLALAGTVFSADITAACSGTDKLRWNGTDFVCATDLVLTEAQVDAYANNNGYLKNIVEDTTPQLGGSLDTQGNAINTSSGDLLLDGTVVINGASPLRSFNVKGSGLNGRLSIQGGAGGNPGVELTTDDNDSRVLMRLNEVGVDGTELAIYTEPVGGSIVQALAIESTGALNMLNHNITNAGIISAIGGNSTNWNNAFGWGDHSLAGYLTSFTEVDGSITNELQDLTFASNILSLTNSAINFDLSAYLDNTDEQDLTLTGNILAISSDPNTDVDLSTYLDNTDTLAALSCGSNEIASWNGTAWICIADDNGTDNQNLTSASINAANILSLGIENGGGTSVDLSQLEHTGTEGSIFFAGTDTKPTEDNANLFWDDVNDRLGVGMNSGLEAKLNVDGDVLIEGQDLIFTHSSLTNIDSISYSDGSNLGSSGVYTFLSDTTLRPNWNDPTAAISARGGYFAGDVGIRTDNPEANLHIAGDGRIKLQQAASGGNEEANFDINVGGDGQLYIENKVYNTLPFV